MSKFYAYRVFLRTPRQIDLFDNKTKEECFKDLFYELKDNYKAKFSHYGTELHVYFFKEINSNIHLWHLAKKQEYVKPMAGDEHIEKVRDQQFPYVHIAINISKQIVLIENRTSVFKEVDTVKNKIETYFNICLSNQRISCSLNEITDKREVWNKIEEFDYVSEFEFDYDPPNFFGTHKDADKLVKEVHEETNFEKFKILIQNKYEGLVFQKNVFGEHISRLAGGAGKYVIKGFKDGFEKVVNSVQRLVSKNIENIDQKTEDEWEDIFQDIDSLNDDENGEQ